MKVYLDMCCYNRPYDPQNQLSISMETQAKLFIQDLIKNEKIELVSSYMLDYEASNIPMMERKQTVCHFLDEHVSEYVGEENRTVVEKKADEIMATGIKIKDAAHVASAILTHCDYFISTDKRLLRYATDEIRMVNPIDFVREWEGEK